MLNLNRNFIRSRVLPAIGLPHRLVMYYNDAIKIGYIDNPKSGCTTFKSTLANEQFQSDPSRKVFGLIRDPSEPDLSDVRAIVSSARNPYARALSGYLHRVVGASRAELDSYPEFRGKNIRNFQDYLHILKDFNKNQINPHFRSQYINHGITKINMNYIFYLEKIDFFKNYINSIDCESEIKNEFQNSTGAVDKINIHYNRETKELVDNIFKDDFEFYGYRKNLDILEPDPSYVYHNKKVYKDDLIIDQSSESEVIKNIQKSLIAIKIKNMKII